MQRSASWLLASAIAAVTAPVAAANIDGTLDAGYGTQERRSVNGFLESTEATLRATALSPSGRIWTFADDPVDTRAVYITRSESNGTPDLSFNGDGRRRVATPAGLGAGEPAISIDGAFVQTDGKPLVFGGLYPVGDAVGAFPGLLCRFAVAGNFDATFGTSGCRPLRSFLASEETCWITDAEQGPAGDFVAIGNCHGPSFRNRPFLARLTATGALDLEFGGGAGLLTPVVPGVSSQEQYFEALALRGDGTIVVLAQVEQPDAVVGSNRDLAVVQFDGGGTLDAAFGGGDGVAVIRYDTGADQAEIPVDVELRADGRIAVLGQATALNPIRAVAIFAQLTSLGLPDATFGGDGIRIDEFDGELSALSRFRDLAIDVDGKLVAGGSLSARDNVSPTAGTDFWVAQPRPVPPQYDGQLVISSEYRTSGVVESAALGFTMPFDVVPGRSTVVNVPQALDLTDANDLVTDKGIHIRSHAPVAVAQLSGRVFALDSARAAPTNMAGRNFRIGSWDIGLGAGSTIAVVATENDTSVTITPKVTAAGRPAGVPYVVALDRGQAYQLYIQSPDDLTGSLVQSDRPVVVYGGHSCGIAPTIDTDFCDFMLEQQAPVERWGTEFLVAPYAGRPSGVRLRILAHENQTAVSINGNPLGVIAAGAFLVADVQAGVRVTSNKRVAVHQYAFGCKADADPACLGDPNMLTVTPVTDWVHRHAVTTPKFETQDGDEFVTIISRSGSEILVDGELVQQAQFQPLGSTGFVYAAVPVEIGTHVVSAREPVSVFAHANTPAASWAHQASSLPTGHGLETDDLVVRYRADGSRDPIFGANGFVRFDHGIAYDTDIRSVDLLQNLVVTSDSILVGTDSVNRNSEQSLQVTYRIAASELFRDGFE